MRFDLEGKNQEKHILKVSLKGRKNEICKSSSLSNFFVHQTEVVVLKKICR